MSELNFDGILPANVTPFTSAGDIDYDSLARQAQWLASVEGVKGIVCNGHAGEGLSLTTDERNDVIRALVDAVEGRVPIIAGIGGEGSKVAAVEATEAAAAGAEAVLLYPSHGWLRFGFQPGAPQDRYRIVAEESGLPQVLFIYPDVTAATYNLDTILELCSFDSVVAMKNGVRNMRRWDTEIPVVRDQYPDVKVMTCHDEYLFHTMFDVDGALVGYGSLAPEPLYEMLTRAKARDYAGARAVHDKLLPLTKAVYHRGSHMEGSVALKHGLVARGVIATADVRSPLLPLPEGAEEEVVSALRFAGLGAAKVPELV
ncbi:dihydrodipicolinate synthase family protein [Microbacterium sp. STN6]|uniref:dihydrodipicolinate synthase family protein n=1 Tax=Microbacterium sp. STN6 TaxID=2995588 RepID=UPI002260F5E6|nr:dihydrodipicolinate synthase family protein [Microbacterium sp. STN6]MCX7522812.1 dihydrodipicolinate synthase family protein [Microbacterium sp. STN6]